MTGLMIEARSKEYGYWNYPLQLPAWWDQWDEITLRDQVMNRPIVRIERGQIVDQIAALSGKIDELLAQLAKQDRNARA